jgi:GT2 family glycosyltransferase
MLIPSSDVDIVLPIHINQNSQIPMTVKAIEELKRYALLANLIAIDSSGTFEDYVDEFFCTEKPCTYAQNVNIGLKLSTRPFILIASNDVFPDKMWLDGIGECFEDGKCGVGTLLSTQFNEEPRNVIEEGFFGGFWMVSRKCFEDVGYLDEKFINSFEDADYWIRVLQAGYKLLINRGVMVEHLVSRTISNDKNHVNNFLRGREIFNKKHKDCGLELFERLK